MTSPGQFGRALADKNWQLKATYVEVCGLLAQCIQFRTV